MSANSDILVNNAATFETATWDALDFAASRLDSD